MKEGRYNEIETGKYMSEEEIRRLKGDLEAVEREREELRRENHRLKNDGDKVNQY